MIKTNNILIISLFFLFACGQKYFNLNKEESKDFLLNVIIADTLNVGENYGTLEFKKKVDDSIKLRKDDLRAIFLCITATKGVTMHSHKCDSFSANSNKVNDILKCPFKIDISSKLSKGYHNLVGVIHDNILVTPDVIDTTGTRVIENEYHFVLENKVYVK